MSQPRVLCVAAPNWLGVSRLPRILAAAGCRVSLLAHPRSYAARSRYVSALVPGTGDAAANVEVLRLHLAAGASYDWIILADDPIMAAASRRCREDWLRGWFPVDPASDKPELLIRKTRFLEAAAAAGLPVPASRSASSPDELRAAARDIGFPLIVKPAEGFAGTGIFTAASQEELDRRPASEGVFAVQRLVAGRSGGTAVLFDRDRALWWHSALRARVWPEPYGPSCRIAAVHPPEIPGILAKLAPVLGLRGLCAIDWILPDGGGPPQIIELNPRPPGYLYLTIVMGADLPGALRAFLAGTAAPAVAAEPEGREFGLFPEDAIRAVRARHWKDVARWLAGRAGPLPWDEPALLRSYAWLVAKNFARAFFPVLYLFAGSNGAIMNPWK